MMLTELNFAHGVPKAQGIIKLTPEDFCVEEHLGFELTGEGEHLYLFIEKKQRNTQDMVRVIADTLNLPRRMISYAGLKDKQATTTQWFSLHLPGVDNPSLEGLNTDNSRVLKAIRHNKKLKIGALKENHFSIRVHGIEGDENDLLARIERIKNHGVPNYFGPQRFGYQGQNLVHAKALLLEDKKVKDRHLRGLYYSAARAFLFNQILHHRVAQAIWNQPVSGDVMMLAGSHSIFPIEEVNGDITKRVIEHDLSPAAPLWGTGRELASRTALDIQTQVLAPWQTWCGALEQHDLQRSYRALVLSVQDLEYQQGVFRFTLPSGAYATTVLRELFMMDNAPDLSKVE